MVDLALGTLVAWTLVLAVPATMIFLCLQAIALVRQAQRGGEL